MFTRYLAAGALCLAIVIGILPGSVGSAAPRSAAYKLRLSWDLMPGAVTYHVLFFAGTETKTAPPVAQYRDISAPGLELDMRALPEQAIGWRKAWIERGALWEKAFCGPCGRRRWPPLRR